ncbi:hypothetical protein [uncultured Tateyamaria sp.]|uniref:hypothetical protein n=1 Tax=uncultured Tateyamaria sp. TaxID=455651 RepID=UPI00262AE61C|nr:hypothetical protein [uncultured Tateyamaria sp.]
MAERAADSSGPKKSRKMSTKTGSRVLIFDDGETFDYLDSFIETDVVFARCARFSELDEELSREGASVAEYAFVAFDVYCDLWPDFGFLGHPDIAVDSNRCGPQLLGEVLPKRGFDFRSLPILIFSSHRELHGITSILQVDGSKKPVETIKRTDIADKLAEKMLELGFGFSRSSDHHVADAILGPKEYCELFLSLADRVDFSPEEIQVFLGTVGRSSPPLRVFETSTLPDEKVDILLDVVAMLAVKLHEGEFRQYLEELRIGTLRKSGFELLMGSTSELMKLQSALQSKLGGVLLK